MTEYKYLGVLLNYNGRFCKGELELKETPTRAMYSLISKCRKFDLPVDIQLKLFTTMVLPILTCAAEILGYHIARELRVYVHEFFKAGFGCS